MQKIVLFVVVILMFTGCTPVHSTPLLPASDDLQIYQAALAENGYAHPILRAQTAFRGFNDPAEISAFVEDQIDQETAANLIAANQQQAALGPVFAGARDITFLSAQEEDEIFTNHPSEGWDEFHRRYPNVDDGLVSLSAIGYNADHSEAIVGFGVQRGPKAGAGGFVVLKKTGGQWHVVLKKELWKS